MHIEYKLLDRDGLDNIFKMFFEESLRSESLEIMMEATDSIEGYLWLVMCVSVITFSLLPPEVVVEKPHTYIDGHLHNRLMLANTPFMVNTSRNIEISDLVGVGLCVDNLKNPTQNNFKEYVIYVIEELGLNSLTKQDTFCILLYEWGLGVCIIRDYL